MRFSIPLLAAALISAVCEGQAPAQTYTYQTIIYPNTMATYLRAIDSEGTAVGWIFDINENTYGLIYSKGEFKTVQLGPAGGQTYLTNINDAGVIVGNYENTSLNYISSYAIQRDGTVKLLLKQTFDYYETVTAINDVGSILGSGDSVSGEFLGFLELSDGSLYPISTGASETEVSALNNKNEIVGYDFNPSSSYYDPTDGFLLSGKTFTKIDYPGQQVTYLDGINDYGIIVGSFTPMNQYPQGFLYDHGTFVPIAVPGSVGTNPSAINNSGVIVGYYWGADNSMGAFIATPDKN